MLLLAGGRVVTPGGVLSPGWIRLDGPVIEAVGSGGVPDQPAVDLRGQWVLPGFVDLHVHGGGGASFTEGTGDEARRAAAFHHGHGTTTMLASLVTAPQAELEARAALLADLAEDGVVAGLHLEGPFLSPVRRGAQDPRHMIAPDVAVFECLRRSTAGGSGASPGPTASITGPASRIQPGLSTPSGVTTRPPVSRRSAGMVRTASGTGGIRPG